MYNCKKKETILDAKTVGLLMAGTALSLMSWVYAVCC